MPLGHQPVIIKEIASLRVMRSRIFAMAESSCRILRPKRRV
jgi:hypothetical protein